MPKSIHERVRATLAAQDKARKIAAAKAMAPHNRRMGQAAARDTRRERRIDALIAGDVQPRNADELAILDRAYDLTDGAL